MTLRASVAAGFAVLMSGVAFGTTFLPLSDRDLLDRADAVVLGTVGQVGARAGAAGIVTDAELRVDDVIKGALAPAEMLTISELGGSAGGRTMIIDGAPRYTPGQRVLAFLKRADDGHWYTVGMSRGQFALGRNLNGENVFVRDPYEAAPERPRLASEFLQYLRGHQAVRTYLSASPAALQPQVSGGGAEYCLVPPGFSTPVRWKDGEVATILFAVSGSQPGIDTSGLANDANAWTNVPTAGISLVQTPSTPAADPSSSTGPNTVFLNYPGTVAGFCDARACTVLWVDNTVTHSYGGDTFFNLITAHIVFQSGFTQVQFNALAKHEFGHMIGLRHSNEGTPFSTDAIMVSAIDVGQITDLRDWDIDAVSTVYGAGAPCHPAAIFGVDGGGVVPFGEKATLTVKAKGSAPLSYQWYSGASGNTSSPIGGATAATYTTGPITASMDLWVRVTASCGTPADSATINVSPAQCVKPRIVDQPASRTVTPNTSVTLEVFADGTEPLTYQWYIGAKGNVSNPASGTSARTRAFTISVTQTTSFWAQVSNSCGSADSETITVTVSTPSTGANVQIGDAPAGLVQSAGQGGATDSFTVTNIGTEGTSITLAPSGDFFTITPTSFALGVGAVQRIAITGTAQAASAYSGTVAINGNGARSGLSVLVRLLSAAAPSGVVDPHTTTARVEVSSNAGQNASGFVEFTNTGSATLQGIAVSDVPWLIPQTGLITIPPGQTVQVSYTIDSSKRPDGDAPLGGVTGKISLVYVTGGASGVRILADAPGTSSISVTLVHVAKPSTAAGTPPALNAGEVALLITGLGNKTKATGDLLLGNRTATAASNVQLFVQGLGAQPQTTTLSQLVANSSVALPGLLKNVFNTPVATGMAQVRGADVSRVSVAAIQSNTSLPVGTYSTALPVFRSERAVSSSDTIVLSGLAKDGAVQTDLFVQESSGVAGSFRIDFLNSAGQVISSRNAENVAAFGFAELTDAVPAGATAARITSASTGGKLSAYALVTNPTTGDGWPVVDPAAGATTDDAFIAPILTAGSGAETFLYTTNRGSASANVTIDIRGTGGVPARRRAAGRTPPGALIANTLAPSETRSTKISHTAGYIRISGPAAAISAAARSLRTSGSSVFGTGLPVVSTASALRSGESRRFTSVDDASVASRTKKVPATFRTSLEVVETANQAAVVRVTLQFAFSGGSLVSSTARVSKDYAIAAGEYLVVSDLAREVIGTSRDSFGDLRNMTLDVEVASGSGRVLPFLQSVDNGSGDTLVRTE